MEMKGIKGCFEAYEVVRQNVFLMIKKYLATTQKNVDFWVVEDIFFVYTQYG